MVGTESLDKFVRRLPNLATSIKQKVKADWTRNTILAGNEAKRVAPKKYGTLQRSLRFVKAEITPTGIESAFIFAVPYAYDLEIGERNGKELNISTDVNPEAISGYSTHGIEKYEKQFIDDLKKAIGESFKGGI